MSRALTKAVAAMATAMATAVATAIAMGISPAAAEPATPAAANPALTPVPTPTPAPAQDTPVEGAAPGAARQTLTPGSSAVVEVWARALFSETGQLEQLEFADQAEHPEAFLAEVRRQLAAARIRPPTDEGQPAKLQTGVRLRYGVRAGETSGRLRLLDLAIRPLPVERVAPLLPLEIRRTQAWTGQVRGVCSIDTEGRCVEVEVQALPGMPESLRRWARVTMSQWRFEPQRLNDRPMPGEFEHTFNIRTGDFRPEDFRTPRFDRIERQRR